jgi:hypothetical protein
VRVIREVDARRRIGGAPGGIDAEGTDFPVGGNGPDHEEDKNQCAREQKETEPTPPAPIRFAIRARHVADWRRGDDGLRHRRGWNGGGYLSRRENGGGDLNRRGNGGGILSRRANRCGSLHSRLYLCVPGFDRRTRSLRAGTTRQLLQLCPGGADGSEGLGRYGWGSGVSIGYRRLRQLGKPILQLCLIGSLILRWYGTPWEAHVRPRYRRSLTTPLSRVVRPRSSCDSGVTIASQARARGSSAGRPGHRAPTQ